MIGSRKEHHLDRLREKWIGRLRAWLGVGGPLGQRAERAAARELRRSGYRILGRNVRCRVGEIDIVAEDRATAAVVIVEVKAAAADDPPPEQHVNYAKRRKLTALANETVRRYGLHDRTVRFDVVAIVWPEGAARPSRLTHYANAFDAV